MVLYVLAFLSGAAALIYEVTWAQMLALTFGSSTLSATAVIAGFMGGMGIGARLYQLVNDRVRRPLLIYGALEIGIGLCAALLTLVFYSLPQLFALVSRVVPPGPWLGVVRFVGVFALLLIPSALMGATFPALCTVMIRSARGVDRRLGMIYGINTIGGAAGVMLGGLYLIERFGLSASVRVANGINLLVGCVAFALWAASRRSGEERPIASMDAAIPTLLPSWLTGGVLFLSGFTTLSYEILWFRALRLVVGNSTYALSAVLIIFLLGLGAGSLMLRRVARRRSPERDLAMCQFAIAALALWAMACESLVLSHPAVLEHISIFSGKVRLQPWWWKVTIDAGIAAVTMLPAALFMGLSFPLASRLFLGDVRKLGTRVGTAYLLANLGSILGAVLAGVLLLPWLGVIGGTKLLAAVNLTLGIFVVAWLWRRVARVVPPALIATAVVVAMFFAIPSSLGLRGEGQAGRVVYEEDAYLGTVQILEDPRDPAKRRMLIDGCTIGCGAGYLRDWMYRKQVVLAHLPMVLDARIRRTLNIGLGSASTLHTLAKYPEIERLDCVEINEAVVRASRLFPESSVLDDKRVNLIVDDAVHFLLRCGIRYDAIISDGKQDPLYSGNATLLCREYYRYAQACLSDNGLFVQWLSTTHPSSDFRINLRTLCDVFPHVEVFFLPPSSAFMVASARPVFGRPGLDDDYAARASTYQDLGEYFIDSAGSLLSRSVAGKTQLQGVLDDGPVSTWDHLILDYSMFKSRPRQRARANLDNLRMLLAAENLPRTGGPPIFSPHQKLFARSSKLVRYAYVEYYARNSAAVFARLEQAIEANPADRAPPAVLGVMREEIAQAASPKNGNESRPGPS